MRVQGSGFRVQQGPKGEPAATGLGRLTPAQLEAIRETGCSLLVSAAAGAGKTTVLAERCVALVCEVAERERCDIDQLLVVTFTDAAAEEMRTRIRAALREVLTALLCGPGLPPLWRRGRPRGSGVYFRQPEAARTPAGVSVSCPCAPVRSR